MDPAKRAQQHNQLDRELQQRPELLRDLVHNPRSVLESIGVGEEALCCTPEVHTALARGARVAAAVNALGEIGPVDALPQIAEIARGEFGQDPAITKLPFGIRFSERVSELASGDLTATGTVECTFGLECGPDHDG